MLGLHKKEAKNYIYILGSTGDFRMKVSEDTPGAQKREYETSDGVSGVKYELVYDALSGYVSSVEFYDGDYGKNIILTMHFHKNDDPLLLSIGTSSPYGENLMRKLPNVDFTKPVTLSPYAYEDDKGKVRKGVSISQDGEKIQEAFYDFEKKKALLGFPEVEKDKEYDTDDWKIFFTQCRKFLVKYTEDNIIPAVEACFKEVELPDDGDSPVDEVPFE